MANSKAYLMARIKRDKRPYWLVAAGITLLVNGLFAINPQFTEIIYSRGIYQVLRVGYDYTLGWLPIPSLYLAIVLLLGWIGWRWYKRRDREWNWRQRGGRMFVNALTLLAAVYTLFYWAWGFNYKRVPVEKQLALPILPQDSSGLAIEFTLATQELLAGYQALAGKVSVPLAQGDLPIPLETHMRDALEIQLTAYQFPAIGRVRGRRVAPMGMLMQLGASGIYIPFVGEGHIDGALPPVSRPFTLAHELAHGYGFGDEGSCNFWAYLACEGSKNPAVRYAGRLSYWRYVAGQYKRAFPDAYQEVRDNLPTGISADLAAIRQVQERYPGFFPQLSRRIYTRYLSSQGIKDGLMNYSRVVDLVRRYRTLKKHATVEQGGGSGFR